MDPEAVLKHPERNWKSKSIKSVVKYLIYKTTLCIKHHVRLILPTKLQENLLEQ